MIQIDNINPIKQFEILNCETWVSFSYPNMSKGLWDTTNNWVLCENKIKKVTVEAAGKGSQWEKNGGEKMRSLILKLLFAEYKVYTHDLLCVPLELEERKKNHLFLHKEYHQSAAGIFCRNLIGYVSLLTMDVNIKLKLFFCQNVTLLIEIAVLPISDNHF